MSQWVTQKKFMEQTGLTYGAVCCWRKDGLIPAIKVRGKWLLDIKAFNENLTEKSENIRFHTKSLFSDKSIDITKFIKLKQQQLKEEKRLQRA